MAHNLTQADDYIPPELIGLTPISHTGTVRRTLFKYRELRLELTSTGELIVMPPTGLETGVRNANLTYQLRRGP